MLVNFIKIIKIQFIFILHTAMLFKFYIIIKIKEFDQYPTFLEFKILNMC